MSSDVWDLGELGLAERRSALEDEDVGEKMSDGSSGKVVVVGCFLGDREVTNGSEERIDL